MFRKGIVILLIFGILLQTGRKALIVLWYELNKVEVTELFCINKEDKTLQCNGKCHLGKMLSETESENEEDRTLPEPEERTSYTLSDSFFPEWHLLSAERGDLGVCQFHYNFQLPNSIFHPPRV